MTLNRKDSIERINLDEIVRNKNQPRSEDAFEEKTIDELAHSIRRQGLINPIMVRFDETISKYIIVAGERRFRAFRTLGESAIPAIIITEGDVDELALVENIQREDLNPVDEAAAYRRLMTIKSWSQEQLAEFLGKKRSTITNLLKINRLHDTIKNEASQIEKVSKSLLLEIAASSDHDEQLQKWELVKDSGNTTVQEARRTRNSRKRLDYDKMVSAGQRFARWIVDIGEREIADNEDVTNELVRLRDQINDRLNVIVRLREDRI